MKNIITAANDFLREQSDANVFSYLVKTDGDISPIDMSEVGTGKYQRIRHCLRQASVGEIVILNAEYRKLPYWRTTIFQARPNSSFESKLMESFGWLLIYVTQTSDEVPTDINRLQKKFAIDVLNASIDILDGEDDAIHIKIDPQGKKEQSIRLALLRSGKSDGYGIYKGSDGTLVLFNKFFGGSWHTAKKWLERQQNATDTNIYQAAALAVADEDDELI